MNRAATVAPVRRKLETSGGPIRLDLLSNPFGPSIRVQEALAAEDELHLHDLRRDRRLKERLAELSGVPAEWIVLTNGADEALHMCLLAHRGRGPALLFTPTDPNQARLAQLAGVETYTHPRSHRFMVETGLTTEFVAPPASLAVVQSPNDPTGTILETTETVRLSRRFERLVIDERHAEYGARSLTPLVREFENIAVIQSLELWAGLNGLPIAWVIAPPKLAREIEAHRPSARVAAAAVVAALATLDDLTYVRATVRRIRDEKLHLFRTLRKLNLLQPLPSWANFILARIERGDAAAIQQQLAQRDIFVYRPTEPELPRHLRIAAATPETTRLLKEALIDIARDLP
ncbi:MAG: histidinol-phosphate aminotransferase family protein [Thermomicrobiales bacterium]|nr:histidinol-phosphate aminotransferase family protein [Thermomicrobiales bacterium]